MTTAPNQAPNAPTLNSSPIGEDSPGITVGYLSATDPDGDTVSYRLVDDAGGRFEIVGNRLGVKQGVYIDYETTPTLTVRVVAVDSKGAESPVQSFTVRMGDTNEAPTDITLSANAVNENSANGTVIGRLSLVDPDRQLRTLPATPSWTTPAAASRSTPTATSRSGTAHSSISRRARATTSSSGARMKRACLLSRASRSTSAMSAVLTLRLLRSISDITVRQKPRILPLTRHGSCLNPS
jgi:hypothetical protein